MLSKMLLLETWNIVRNNGGKRRKKLTIYHFYLNHEKETQSVVVGMTVLKLGEIHPRVETTLDRRRW